MQIDDQQILSHERITARKLVASVDGKLEGRSRDYLLLAFRIDAAGEIANDMLILQSDPYGENDDEFLELDGHRYNWEHELREVASVRANYQATFGRTCPEGLVKALKYYLEFDAYLDGESRVSGKWTWDGNKERFAKAGCSASKAEL